MRLRRFGSVLCALLASSAGCELISSIDRTKIDMTPGTGGTGGTGVPPECTVAEDCADPGDECLTRGCTAEGKCVPDKVAAGTPVSQQTIGDCQMVVCDGEGATKSQGDDTDLPVDGKECTVDACTAGVPSHPALAAKTPCGQGGALYCDGNGACVGCTDDAQCGAPTDCATPRCTLGACDTDFVAPGTPIATQIAGDCQEVQCDGLGGTKSIAAGADIVDDGNSCTDDLCVAGAATHPNSPSGTACSSNGIHCNGAGACVPCLTGADCQSLVCTAQVCVAATCSDGVKNGSETDVNCGGPSCAPCADGKRCVLPGDCTSSVCSGSPLTCQAPLCTDSVKNGTETDVDCGGSCSAKCAPTKVCKVSSDCVGGSCVGMTCVPTCTDAVKNGAETDVDCGGSCSAKCGTGKACGAAADCASAVCTGNVCQAPSCTDAVKNGAETDVNCGGPDCADCNVGQTCAVGGDCVTGVCTGSICQAPSCTDTVKNGTETDVDCGGGGGCPLCLGGKICGAPTDCASGVCTAANVCGGPSCLDGVKNSAETDIDCGGGTCPSCANGKVCSADSDCSSGICAAGTCVAVDNEPANDTCAGASPEALPATITPLALPTVTDVDWFMFTATAADVGKKVHVVTTSTGTPNPCDTVVEVFIGASCAALSTLGGPSDDADYSEDWLSAALPAAGPFWVKVSYATSGFSSAPYTLIVSTQ
jgi:hypothetical protein